MSNIKICPIRMMGVPQYTIAATVRCVREKCAWWNDGFGQCAVAAMALTMTRPIVREERRAVESLHDMAEGNRDRYRVE